MPRELKPTPNGYWRTWEPNGGWGNRNQQTVISTHWMPLPQPPKEADRD